MMGLIHSAQNKNTRQKTKKKTAFAIKKMVVKAVFKVEILANFNFYGYFLAALGLSAIAIKNPITASASE
ncbi:MAG: hypothetical protein IJW30_00655 [Clostridia bacterium]|nr:hypothetical protein [Clostridia bacterium]